jgi:hypothetical protein
VGNEALEGEVAGHKQNFEALHQYYYYTQAHFPSVGTHLSLMSQEVHKRCLEMKNYKN